MVKFLITAFFIICTSCKSQKNIENPKVFTEEVKLELLNIVNKYPGKYYLVHYYLPDDGIYIVGLNTCENCYFIELINKSKKSLKFKNGYRIKIIEKEDIDNYKYPENEVHVVYTGGTFTLEIDENFNILRKYSSG